MDGLEHSHTYTSDNYAGFYFRRLRQSTKSATFEPLENLHGMAHCIGTCWHHLSIDHRCNYHFEMANTRSLITLGLAEVYKC